ncbi:hypothetical protein MCGE09_00399 [Thaumarchaeota archaeon SCGC AB-539-E09]|nr:hypothetical protein MCGE09_00399 [Thaumarchaeota archaeon SCGC AB-539-E09]
MKLNLFLFLISLLSGARLAHHLGFRSGLEQGRQFRQEITEEKEN